MSSTPITLTLAHSADADDVFMWWPITGKVDPTHPDRVLEPARLDTGRFTYRAFPADIQELNKRAIAVGDLEITALSFGAYARCRDRYIATSCGSSFGDGYGPKLVARSDRNPTLDDLRRGGWTIAVPGKQTTAFLVLSILLAETAFTPVEMPFDTILQAVSDGRVDAGLIIHEGQLLYERLGLVMLADMGQWWRTQTGGPLPLGANAIRRDLETIHGPGTLKAITRTLRASIDYALAHRSESLDYAKGFSPLKDPADLNRYIDMYVNRWTVDAGASGLAAIRYLFQRGTQLGLLPEPLPGHVDVELLVP
jgi:1,4-dihydroxy-6-naphthoate synthase